MADVSCGILLIGHGTREPAGREEFAVLADAVAARLAPRNVVAAFLEGGEPSMADGFELLVERGVERIAVVPLLLFAAGHAKRDIPQAVGEARRRWPDRQIALAGHLGNHPALVEISHRRYLEAIEPLGPTTADGEPSTSVVLVGRGSRDAEAIAEMRELCRLRGQRSGVPSITSSFVALAEPTMAAVLDGAAASSAERIVVQPHFLFTGVLVERIKAAVLERTPSGTAGRWVLAEHLGPHPLIVDALVDRLGPLLPASPAMTAASSNVSPTANRRVHVAPAAIDARE